MQKKKQQQTNKQTKKKQGVVDHRHSILIPFIKIKTSDCFFHRSWKFFSDLYICTCWKRNSLFAKKTTDQATEFPVCNAAQVIVDKRQRKY